MKIANSSKQNGFTIIELLIVSGLSIVLMLTVSSLFMTFLVGSSTTNMRKTVYAEGNYAINQMAFLIRNALTIECKPSKVTLTSIDALQTVFQKDSNRIASTSAKHGGNLYITSSDVTVNNLSFSCPAAGEAKYIGIDFTLQHTANSSVLENFKSQVLVRN